MRDMSAKMGQSDPCTAASRVGFRPVDAREVEKRRQQIEVVVKCVRFQGLREKFRIVDHDRNVDHFLIDGIGFFAHPVRKSAFSVIGDPQDDRFVHQAGFFELVQNCDDVPVDQLVQIGVKPHIFALCGLRGER